MYLVYRPSGPLGALVDKLWLFSDSSRGEPLPGHAKERVLPDGSMGIIINLYEDRIPLYDCDDPARVETVNGALVVGARTRFTIIDAAQISVAGVQFRPGGARPFFEPPGGELQDAQLPLDLLWRCAARDLRDEMLEAPSPAAKLAALESALIRCAARPLERSAAVAFATRALGHARSVAGVTSQIGISPRRFSDLFRAEVGLTPKAFFRVRRFHQAIRRIHTAESVDWADLALSCGYYDQAHFIHDFGGFAGVSPTAYLAGRTPFMNHVALA